MQANDTLTRTVLLWCEQQNTTLAGKTILCAVSGGRDSMALLHVLLRLSTQIGFSVAAAHYNHRLRESAGRDEDLVRRYCAQRGIPFTVGNGDVRAHAKANGASIEDAARTMRYAFLREASRDCGADYIATAHHRQDNAETLLLHLLRGSGLQGLGGIAPIRSELIRPLLEADRRDIDTYITENDIPYAEDETNSDTAYTRNRLRLELLPLLEEIAPGSVGRIADAAVRLRADEDFLHRHSSALAPEMDENGCVCLSKKMIDAQHSAIAARIIRSAARCLNAELTAQQTDSILRLRSGGCLSLSNELRAAREGDIIRFYRVSAAPPPLKLSLGENQWGDRVITVYETQAIVTEDSNTVVLRCVAEPLTIAAWDGTGRLSVANGRRTVKRLLADHGISAAQREHRPAVFVGETLAAVFGAGTDHALQSDNNDKKIVITLRQEA